MPRRNGNGNGNGWKIGGAGLGAAIVAAVTIWTQSSIGDLSGELAFLRAETLPRLRLKIEQNEQRLDVQDRRLDRQNRTLAEIESINERISTAIEEAVAKGIKRGLREMQGE